MEVWVENRSAVIQCLSRAVTLDHSGDCEAAFGKYLESLNALSLYLKEMHVALGFHKTVEKHCEITRVLSMIRECTDRVQIIVDTNSANSTKVVTVRRREENSRRDSISNDVVTPPSQKFPPFEKLQADNMRIIKQYQWRCERTNNYREKTNIRLELERKLAENAVIAKQKYNTFLSAVKKLQKERLHVMEQQMKELLDNREPSTSLQRDKQRLYRSVFEYTKTETWTCAWKLNPLEMSAYEATQHIFQKIFKCTQHPISQEILLNQNVFKRRLEKKLQEYSEYKHLPDVLTDGSLQGFHDMPHEYVINNGNPIIVSKPRVKSLNKFLESVSSEITNNIENVLEVFYLIYKSLLPEDSEELCYRLIEAHILEPLWPSFISLFRISNISSEYKISRTIKYSETCNARKFGVTKVFIEDIDKGFIQVCRECVIVLKKLPNHISLNEKLKILVEVCQAICGTSSPTSENQGKLGADDLMPLLCYVIVQSGMPQLGSECYAIEQLFNMKYSFGEEGYALSSFLTALKYIEFRVGVED